MIIPDFDLNELFIERGFQTTQDSKKRIINRNFTDQTFDQFNLGTRKAVDTKINIIRLDFARYSQLVQFLNTNSGQQITVQLSLPHENIFGESSQASQMAYISGVSPGGEKDFSQTDNLFSITLDLRLVIDESSMRDWLFVIETPSRGADQILENLPVSGTEKERVFTTSDRKLWEWQTNSWIFIADVSQITSVILNDDSVGLWDGNYYLSLWSDLDTSQITAPSDFSFYRDITFRKGFINEGSFQLDQWSISFEEGPGQLEDTAGFSFSIDNREGFYKQAINTGLAFHGSKVQLYSYRLSSTESIKIARTGINNQNLYSLNQFTFQVRSTILYNDSQYPPQSLNEQTFPDIDPNQIGKTSLRTFGYWEVGRIQKLIDQSGSLDFYEGFSSASAFLILCQTSFQANVPTLTSEIIDSVNDGTKDLLIVDSLNQVFSLTKIVDLGSNNYQFVIDSFNQPTQPVVVSDHPSSTDALTPFFTGVNPQTANNPPLLILNFEWDKWILSETYQKIINGFQIFIGSGTAQSRVISTYQDVNPNDGKSRPTFELESLIYIDPEERVVIAGVSQAFQINEKASGGLKNFVYTAESEQYLSSSYFNILPDKKQFQISEITKLIGEAGSISSSADQSEVFSDNLYVTNYDLGPLRSFFTVPALGTRVQALVLPLPSAQFLIPIFAGTIDMNDLNLDQITADFAVNLVDEFNSPKLQTPLQIGFEDNVYNALLRLKQSESILKQELDLFFRSEKQSTNPNVFTPFDFVLRSEFEITSRMYDLFSNKQGVRIKLNNQISFSPNSETTTQNFPTSTNTINYRMFFVKPGFYSTSLTTNVIVEVDSIRKSDNSEVVLRIPESYLENFAEELKKYSKILILIELPTINRDSLNWGSDKIKKYGSISYDLSQPAIFQPVGKISSQEENILIPEYAEIEGQTGSDSVMKIIDDILLDSPVSQETQLIQFPSVQERAGRDLETSHWQIDSRSASVDLLQFLAGQMSANLTIKPNGIIQARSIFEQDHIGSRFVFNDSNILIGSLQSVRTRRIQEIFQNFTFRFDFRPNIE